MYWRYQEREEKFVKKQKDISLNVHVVYTRFVSYFVHLMTIINYLNNCEIIYLFLPSYSLEFLISKCEQIPWYDCGF